MKLNRIMVTETQTDYPKQLIQVLASHNDLIIYAIASNFQELTLLMNEYKNALNLIPILLDTTKNETENRQLVKHLPKMDTIINFSGPNFLNKFSKAAYKIEDVNIHPHSKIEKVLNKLLACKRTPGNNEVQQSKPLLINILYPDQPDVPQSPISQSATVTATVVAKQVTNNLRSSFRRLFKKTQSVPVENESPSPNSSNTTGGARRAMTLPTRGSSSPASSSSSPHSNLAYFLNTSDFKVSKKLHKLFVEYQKKWKSKEKDFKSWEKKQSKLLSQNMIKFRKDEELILRQSNATATSAAISSPNNKMSSDAVNEMRLRREEWAKKKIDRKVDQKFKTDKANLDETILKEMKGLIEKHYQKLFIKQIEVLEKYVI